MTELIGGIRWFDARPDIREDVILGVCVHQNPGGKISSGSTLALHILQRHFTLTPSSTLDNRLRKTLKSWAKNGLIVPRDRTTNKHRYPRFVYTLPENAPSAPDTALHPLPRNAQEIAADTVDVSHSTNQPNPFGDQGPPQQATVNLPEHRTKAHRASQKKGAQRRKTIANIGTVDPAIRKEHREAFLAGKKYT